MAEADLAESGPSRCHEAPRGDRLDRRDRKGYNPLIVPVLPIDLRDAPIFVRAHVAAICPECRHEKQAEDDAGSQGIRSQKSRGDLHRLVNKEGIETQHDQPERGVEVDVPAPASPVEDFHRPGIAIRAEVRIPEHIGSV